VGPYAWAKPIETLEEKPQFGRHLDDSEHLRAFAFLRERTLGAGLQRRFVHRRVLGAEICAYLEERFPEPALVPTQHREEVLRVADEARSLGPHVRRMAYLAIGADSKLLEKAWTLNVGPAEARDASFRDRTRYLVGDTFTLADLTMASMLSPLARPTEHPFYPRMAGFVRLMRRPALPKQLVAQA